MYTLTYSNFETGETYDETIFADSWAAIGKYADENSFFDDEEGNAWELVDITKVN